MFEDIDYSGANCDALEALGGYDDVSGVDYVGAARVAMTAPGANTSWNIPQARAQLARMQSPQPNMAAARLMQAGAKALQMARKVQADRRLRNAALSGFIPTTLVPISTAAGVTIAAGGALNLNGAAGVPCRPLKYIVEPAIASFFGISGITAARMNMVAGGTGLVPATRFLPTAVQAPLDNPELGGGVPIFVAGANTDGGAHPYFSTFDVTDLTAPTARMT